DDNGTSLDAITPEVGGVWVEQSGAWDIQSNKAECDIAGTGNATVDSGISDCLVDCSMVGRRTDGSNRVSPGEIFRYSDETHFWMLFLDLEGNNVEIYENDAGFVRQAQTALVMNFDTEYDARAILDGQQIDAFVDGGSKASYGSASFNETATIHGIRASINGTPPSEPTYENFAVFPRTTSVFDAQLDSV
ncbi:unnamed protein product, partial [marine sediment metagenome]